MDWLVGTDGRYLPLTAGQALMIDIRATMEDVVSTMEDITTAMKDSRALVVDSRRARLRRRSGLHLVQPST